jgi:hypothetical protein
VESSTGVSLTREGVVELSAFIAGMVDLPCRNGRVRATTAHKP